MDKTRQAGRDEAWRRKRALFERSRACQHVDYRIRRALCLPLDHASVDWSDVDPVPATTLGRYSSPISGRLDPVEKTSRVASLALSLAVLSTLLAVVAGLH